MECKLVVFDLDGTLFQTHRTSVQAIQVAFADLGLPAVDDELILSLMGYQLEELCERLAPGLETIHLQQLGSLITFHEKKFVATEGKLFDGIKEMLMELQSNGYTLAICSNGVEDYVETVLSVCGIAHLFSAVRGKKVPMTKGERLRELLNQYSPTFAVFVGDRVHDFDAAKENGIKSIGMTYGYGGDEVDVADHRAKSATDIVRLVKQLDS